MRLFKSITLRLILALLFGALFNTRGIADPLDPMSFTSLGAFPGVAGNYSLNTSGTPTLTDPLGNVIAGVVYVTPGGREIAVFTFDSITLDAMTIWPYGARPFALLSQDFVHVGTTGNIYANGISGGGGPGGGGGGYYREPGSGPGGGGGAASFNWGAGGGGGFGGLGGWVPFSSGLYGSTYGDLSVLLEGGSGGGGAWYYSLGGGGGGAVEIGAVNDISISGTVNADGGNGDNGAAAQFAGGGGSGGGIIVHGATVTLTGLLSAAGGGTRVYGGGGGGGRIYIRAEHFGYGGAINVAAGWNGGSGVSGDPGVITLPANVYYPPVANAGNDQSVQAVHDGDGDPANGSAFVTLDGTASADPQGESLTYAWDDGQGHSANGSNTIIRLSEGSYAFTLTVTNPHGLFNTDVVNITVNPEPNVAPIAANMSLSLNQDTSKDISLNLVDPDADSLIAFVGSPTHGTLTFTGANSVAYTPNPQYSGSDSFAFAAIDPYGAISNTATCSLTVNHVNHAPVAQNQGASTHTGTGITLIATDIDGDKLTYTAIAGPSHGSLSGSAPNLIYTPAANYSGPDSFTFKANDGQIDSNTATVSITVTNTAPRAVNDSATTKKATAVTINVLANDSDPDGDTLSVSSLTQPASGTVVKNANNTLTLTPAKSFIGTTSFTYTISDGHGGSATATVTVNVTK